MRWTATPVSFSRSAMTGPSVWPSYGLPCSALACSTNCPPLGAVTPYLATDGFGDPADLAADPDLEPIGIVVAVIALVAVDAAHGNTREAFEIGDDGTERMAD